MRIYIFLSHFRSRGIVYILSFNVIFFLHWRYFYVRWSANWLIIFLTCNETSSKVITNFLHKIKIQLYCFLSHSTWNLKKTLHTKETRIERDTCTPVFIAALFIIARTWKQPRYPPADEWIRKLWYIYTMEYYSAIKKNTFESVLMRWMKLKPIIQSEISQKEKHQYSILTHIYGI